MTRREFVTFELLAGTGLCAALLGISPQAAAAPVSTGGYHCVEAIGAATATCAVAAVAIAPAPAAAPAPVAAPVAPVVPVAAPIAPVAAPVAPVVPAAAPVVPAAAPVAAPAAVPAVPVGGVGTGKGAPTVAPANDGPVAGIPIQPGPTESLR